MHTKTSWSLQLQQQKNKLQLPERFNVVKKKDRSCSKSTEAAAAIALPPATSNKVMVVLFKTGFSGTNKPVILPKAKLQQQRLK